ncbi:MAG: aspartate aminotransferase family protein, partial [Acidobacteriota bacterium]
MTETRTARVRELPPCDHEPRPWDGPSRRQVQELRDDHYNPGVFTYYSEPLMIVEGHMQYLWDETGRRYLDLFAGIVTVSCGHCHPRVTERTREQLGRLQHTTTIYLHPEMARFAEELAARLPAGLDSVYFVNSGSEANDLAVTMARLFTGHEDVVAVRNGYHGGASTPLGLTSHSTWKFPVPQGGRIHHAVCPDPYRSPFTGDAEAIGERSARDIDDVVRYGTPGKIAAFIAEPIQGVGGATMGPPNYLRRAYEIAREHEGLCVADEVQTGLGRTGEHYWGFENWDVVPDVVTMAKGLGNGFPLAAVVTRREIAETMTRRIHFNTFGGNPVAMATGRAVLEVIDEDGLQDNSLRTGRRLRDGLERLAESHALIGDVRGLGLMLGVELVLDRETKEPATEATVRIHDDARRMGLLLG